jgi:hypothetical protein
MIDSMQWTDSFKLWKEVCVAFSLDIRYTTEETASVSDSDSGDWVI